MIEQFLDYLKVVKNVSDNTLIAYNKDLCLFRENCLDIVNASQEDIIKFIKCLNNYNPSSRNRIIFSSLSSFFNYLISKKIISENPVKGLEKAKTSKEEITVLLDEEIKSLIKYMEGEDDIIKERNILLIKMLQDTGARISEIVNLKKNDVIGTKVKIHGKGNKQRTNFILDKTKTYLNKVILDFAYYGNFEFIFIDKKGKKLSRTNAYNIIHDTAIMIGLEKKVTPHIFRHTFATKYLANGGTESGLRKLMGWSSNKMLDVYRHINLHDLENEYKRTMKK